MIKHNSFNHGFILTETLLGIALTSICLTIIMGALIQSYRALVLARQYSEARLVLEEYMPRVLSRSEDLESVYDNTKFSLSTEVTSVNVRAIPMEHVSLMLTWTSGKKHNTVALETFRRNTL